MSRRDPSRPRSWALVLADIRGERGRVYQEVLCPRCLRFLKELRGDDVILGEPRRVFAPRCESCERTTLD